ncbi:hypothetical protein [Niemeyer virus]|uniref:Uncharacterized protein n=1 Tax=Acanthamoeba polyphaga mimivirus Kroon TaxID=3069720 RepID=A0A0G2Y9W3_9VIRU|nr:hypothetical protein QJ850_gp788 [Acanthamoeba polyphaga mimivirus]AKI79911.1 hypothetical protein [Acanthamoeba polyphaga mimivirus Kroon]ALR83743.1 hypothetical protein [Niemeyer virus]
MGDFVFCYGLHNKNRLSKYIKQTKKSLKLYLDNDNYINVKMKTQSGQKYIVVDFNDSLDFLKFIVEKKIYCDEYKHDCESLCLHNDYLEYIVENKYYDIIKFYCKKFVPLIKLNNDICVFFHSLFVDIDQNDFKYIFKHSCLEDIKPHIVYVLITINTTIEFMDDIISIYKNKLTKLFTSGKILDLELCKIKIDPKFFLISALKKDDVKLFEFVIEEICNLTNEIDKTKLDKKQSKLLEKFEVNFDFKFIDDIISNYMLDDFNLDINIEPTYFCPNIFRQILLTVSDIKYLDNGTMFDILAYDIVEYMGIICDFIGDSNPELINGMLIDAKSTEMAQLLIDYGAEYEKLYESQEFHECHSNVKKLIKKLIKETSDS